MTTFSFCSTDGQSPLNRCLDTTDGQAQWFAIINQQQPSEFLIERGCEGPMKVKGPLEVNQVRLYQT